MKEIKELRDKYSFYIEATDKQIAEEKYKRGFGKPTKREKDLLAILQEYLMTFQIIDERIKSDSIFGAAISDIALMPQMPIDKPKDIADAMRVIAIGALDDTRKFRYGLK